MSKLEDAQTIEVLTNALHNLSDVQFQMNVKDVSELRELSSVRNTLMVEIFSEVSKFSFNKS